MTFLKRWDLWAPVALVVAILAVLLLLIRNTDAGQVDSLWNGATGFIGVGLGGVGLGALLAEVRKDQTAGEPTPTAQAISFMFAIAGLAVGCLAIDWWWAAMSLAAFSAAIAFFLLRRS